jgi:hypothetical protein
LLSLRKSDLQKDLVIMDSPDRGLYEDADANKQRTDDVGLTETE